VTYRSGNGVAGDVGADEITYCMRDDQRIESVRNPLASAGGEGRTDVVVAQREAPEAVRDQKRCVSDADFVRVAESVQGVTACVVRRWTGTSSVVNVYVSAERDADLKRDEVAAELATQRLIDTVVEVRAPRLVGVVVVLDVGYAPPANESEVEQRVAAAAKAVLQGRGMGNRLFASWLVDAALSVPGVTNATLKQFERWRGDDALAQGFIAFGPTEVPVLVDGDGIQTDGRPLVTASRA
jgi:hypothetical protein